MSMLAGPRRKQKLSADPRGNAWSKDDSKFGQKLLEKFGWAKGKGLGANEDGNVDHVKISVKNDTRGVGCSRNHADNWIAHQDDFNDLLSSLNENAPEKDTNDEKDSDQVTGLEEKSKASRSRVHYQKFTKGKDLSSRSREDMACIFGRRKVKQDADLTPSSEDDESSSDNQGKAEHGVVTVRSTDSVQDYFAKKMAEKKASMASQNTDDKSEDEMRPGFGKNNDTINNADEEKITAKKKVRFSLGEEVEVDVDMSKTKKKKSKKNRKSKDNEESIGEITKDNTKDVGQGESEDSSNNEDIDKSDRKRKRSSESQVDEDAQVVNSKKRKKSKKRKTKTGEDHEMSVQSDEANFSSIKTSDQHETKISKRKQEKLLTQTQVESDEESRVKSKKMKKSKKVKADVCEDDSENNPQIDKSNNQSVKSKKKKKKRKNKPIVD